MLARIQQLEAATGQNDGKAVKNIRTTTFNPYPELLKWYPAIGEPTFYTAKLAKDHKFFDMNDYHFTSTMVYKAPAVLNHNKDDYISPAAKLHDADLASIQTQMAHHTRFYDTLAHEIIKERQVDTEFGRHILQFLNTVRLATANDVAKISCMRSKLNQTALGVGNQI
ncbi:hypothetical protein BGZ58_006732 [Dissophora ornata]|nr:hypothetical protein BGZ58_006732 [Dissophora ornata]